MAESDDELLGDGRRAAERGAADRRLLDRSRARGRGLASAATRALTGWAFETFGPPRIALHAEPGNVASRRVAEKCGFVRVSGTIKGADDRDLWVFELARPC